MAEASQFGSARVAISLVCMECESRNYKTSRKPTQQGQLELKKFCPRCKRHTIHKETK
jgi:large subunit ribosomal protein L33